MNSGKSNDQLIRWGFQTLAWSKHVNDYANNGPPSIPDPDTTRILEKKGLAASQALWDVTVEEFRQTAKRDEAILRYAARIITLAADQISSTEYQENSDKLKSLKATIEEARKECTSPFDNAPVEVLTMLGQNLVRYLASHNDQYPDELSQLDELPGDHRFTIDYTWVSSHIKYLGAGKQCRVNPPDMIIAYDMVMLANHRKTHVLFNDSHVEHLSYAKAKQLGLMP